MSRSVFVVAALAGLAALPATLCAQITVPGAIIVKGGDSPPGAGASTVGTVNTPFTTKTGHCGFTGVLSPTDGFVFFNNRIIWRNTNSADPVLTGVEGTSGVGNGGTFIYSPTAAVGRDAVWGEDGMILAEGDPAPGIKGMFSIFNSRPEMCPDGRSYWMGGIDDNPAGPTSNRVLWTRDPVTGVISKVFMGGETIAGIAIATGGSNFTFHVADNSSQRIHVIQLVPPTATDTIVARNNTDILLREGTATGGGAGENWTSFDEVGINNQGNWIMGGVTTTTVTPSNDVVVYNGAIRVRNGVAIDGITITNSYVVNGVAINNQDEVVFCYRTTADQVLYFGNGPNIDVSARRILKTGDQIDVDGDTVGDWLVNEIKTSTVASQGIDLDDSGYVFVEVDIQPSAGGAEVEAIIKIATGGGCPGDWNGDGVTNSTDVGDLVNDYFTDQSFLSTLADWNGDGQTNSTDVGEFINAWFATDEARCGT